ncbi:MAG: hypothetical protein RXR20_20565 [Paraburkholderia sp.]|jgi:hypothetical protein
MGGKGGSSTPSTTPAEQQASASAQPYLAEYNSGTLNATDQATVNLADTNQTAATLQSFAESGMGASTSLGQAVGTVTKGTSTTGMQAGAGSAVDLSKLSLTNQILNYDLQMGQAYLQISSGQAADLATIQEDQAQATAAAFSKVSQSFAQILGTPETSTDLGGGYGGDDSDAGASSQSAWLGD